MNLQIPCRKCGMELRVRDPKLLGRMGRCPKCGNRFTLEAPDEVQLELVESPGSQPAAQAPLVVGTGAQWVPDTPGGAAPRAAVQRVAAPQYAAVPEPVIPLGVDPGVERLKQLKLARRKARRRQSLATIIGLLAVAGGVGAYYAMPKSAKPDPKVKVAAAAVDKDDDREALSTKAVSPTKGKPISTLYIPSGARIIINMHPAAMWQAGGNGEGEFVACFGPVGVWMSEAIKTFCLAEPAQIEELLFCIIPAARGTPPDVAAIVTLKEAAKKSELLERFGGERTEDGGIVYYSNGDWTYHLRDTRTYVIVPTKMAGEMAQARDYAQPTDTGIEEILPHTDSDRMMTIVLVPKDIRLHGQFLAPDNAQMFIQKVGDWLASDGEVEAVAWSFHLEDDKFFSELLLRTATIITPTKLQAGYRKLLMSTPHRILDAIQSMDPKEFGHRRLIGRVPAMSKVVALNTHLGTGERYLSLTTQLPERAAPNLALGTLLAWDESTRTDFQKSKTPGSSGGGSAVPDLIADRFKTKIDVDFRREPLFSAFDYIANEAKFAINVDGDALKMSGYTKNMPQTFKLDGVPAAKALQQIITAKGQTELCIIVDEQKKMVTVMTVKVAETKGLKPFQF